MRLVKDTSPGGWAVQVRCVDPRHQESNKKRPFPRAGDMFTLAEGYSDLDGEPFVSYYCDDCVTMFHPESLPRKEA